jgi:hypothetical protein
MSASSSKKTPVVIYAIGIIGAIAIAGVLVSVVSSKLAPPDLNAQRRTERLKLRDEVVSTTTGTLTNAAVIDADRAIYRIPVESAKELVLKEWQNPANGRKILLDRVDKATAKLPEKPSAFE